MFRSKREKAISLILVTILIISFFNVPFGGIKSVNAEENDSFSISVLAKLQDEKYVSTFDYQKAYYDNGDAAIIILQIYPALPEGYTIKLANEQVGQMLWGCDSCKATTLSDSKYYPTSAYPLEDEDRGITEVELRGYTSYPLDDFTRNGELSVDVVKLSDTSESPTSYGHIDMNLTYCNSEVKHTVTFISDDENGYVYKDEDGKTYTSYDFTYPDGEWIDLDDDLVDYTGTPYKVVTGWKKMDENGSFDGNDIYGDDWNRKAWNEYLSGTQVFEDMTFKAIWEDGYKITYDANEAEGGYISTPGLGKVTQYSQKVLKNTEMWLWGNIYTSNTNKVFSGWRSSVDNKLYEKYDNYIAKESVNFTAEFVDAVTVTFDANGGYLADHEEGTYHIAKGSTITNVPNMRNAGQVRVGWKDSKGEIYDDNSIWNVELNEDTTFYAIWQTAYDAKVVLHSNYPEELNWEDEEYELESDDGKVLLNSPWSCAEYVIDGWKTSDGKTYKDYEYYIPESEETVDFYAIWRKFDTYTVTYHSNYPEDWNMEEKTYEEYVPDYNGFIPQIGKFEGKEGFVPTSWFYYEDGNAIEVSSDKYIQPKNDMDLYAVWEESDDFYCIKVSSNYPEDANFEDKTNICYISTFYKKIGEYYSLFNSDFDWPEAYMISGWKDSAGNSYERGFETELTGNVEFTAQWKERGKVVLHTNYPEGAGIENKISYGYLDDNNEIYLRWPDDYGLKYPNGINFIGWSVTESGDEILSAYDYYQFEADTELYAQWDIIGERYKITLHSNREGEAEEETKVIYTDYAGNFTADENSFEGKDDQRIIGWKESEDGGSYGSINESYTNRDMDLYAIWGTQPLITYQSAYPEESGAENVDYKSFTDSDGYLTIAESFYCGGYNIDYFVDSKGNKYKLEAKYHFDQDTKLTAVWKEAKAIKIYSSYPDGSYGDPYPSYENSKGYYDLSSSYYTLDDIEYYLSYYTTKDGDKYYSNQRYKFEEGTELYAHYVKVGIEKKIVLHSNYPSDWNLEQKDVEIKTSETQIDLGDYSDQFTPCNGASLDGFTTVDGVKLSLGGIAPDGDMDLYASWFIPDTYTIKFLPTEDYTINYDDEDYAEGYSLKVVQGEAPGYLSGLVAIAKEEGKPNANIWIDQKDGTEYTYDDLASLIVLSDRSFVPGFNSSYCSHEWDDGEILYAPSCTESGCMKYTCTLCGEVYYDYDVLPAEGHDEDVIPGSEPTCEEEGWTDGVYCSRCGETLVVPESIPPYGHNEVSMGDYIEPTCTECGYTESTWCDRCGMVIFPQQEIPPLGHSMSHYYGEAATCTEDGQIEYWFCDNCGCYFADENGDVEVWDLTISAEGHSMTHYDAVTATCTEDGNSEYWSCDNCDKYFSDEYGVNEIDEDSWIIPASHNLTKHAAETATCTTDGNSEYWSCDNCNKYFSDAQGTNEIEENSWIISAGHNLTKHAAEAATCTEAGNSEYWSCDNCNKYFSDEQGTSEITANSWVVGATGHNMVSHTAVAATCTEDGNSAYWSCDKCSKYFSDAAGENEIEEDSWIIPAGHKLTKHDAVEVTCTEAGNSAYWSCDNCDKYFSDAQGENEIVENSWVIGAAGHKLTSHGAVAATCTADGNSAYWSCDNCDKYFSDAQGTTEIEENSWIIPAAHKLTSHGAVAATCTADGNNAYWSCDNCDKYFSDAQGTTEIEENSWIIPAAHKLTSHGAVAATCTADGNNAYWSCDNCDKYFSDAQGTNEIEENSWVEEATGHKLTKQNKKAATCTADGHNEYWSCDNCDKCFSDEEGTTEIEKDSCVIHATGHTVVVDKAVAATTTSTGLTEGSHCSTCGAVLKKQQTIPKLQDKTTDPQPEPDKTPKQTEKKYSSEWVDGKWYNEDGTQTYKGTIIWKSNSTGWWIEDTAGWYPTDSWQKIDGAWYYFKPDGYMAESEYYNGYWFNSDGTMDETYYLTWKSNSTGWWVEDKSGWWPSSQWLKIDGSWYYFDGSGYMVTSQYVDGYWIGANGVCQ